MSVAQYEHNFLELSHFAPALVVEQEERCQKFLDGLRLEIRHTVATVDWNVFGNLVESAMGVELSINELRSRQDRGQNWSASNFEMGESSSKNQRPRGPSSASGPARRGSWGGSPQHQAQAPVPSISHGTSEMDGATTFSSPPRC
ncbi:hypothetical protein CFOL_v3_05764 [Cephalotus follicularis]|uniref:Retrotransposon gag domain-containing protein n=1 Tax=Cephalotus follicularis TaxID=3775 RepID=A0A1Q3B2Q1_CEPFO|nr:hypothetical protein CFOL_v3_05764 [Cephalotus follicularis]